MTKSKKAQGITFNVIIVAAVALVVLIVLIAIFTGKIGKFGKDLDKTSSGATCDAAGGTWKLPADCDDAIYAKFSDYDEHPNHVCCKKPS